VPHIEHALHLGSVLPADGTIVDLGSGAGLPGLPLIVARPDLRWVFVDSQQRRSVWLGEAIEGLGATARAEARHERAEITGRGVLRGGADAVVARAFGAPAITAECGAPLVRVDGWLWVSEPPEPGAGRWPAEGLAALGLEKGDRAVPHWQGLRAAVACPDRYPRRVGIPEKRPLF
jgi:16S rRNA (guanine527-N7)-methyltransferase